MKEGRAKVIYGIFFILDSYIVQNNLGYSVSLPYYGASPPKLLYTAADVLVMGIVLDRVLPFPILHERILALSLLRKIGRASCRERVF